MEYKYLYIDDNSKENALGVITGLELKDNLSIEFDNPKGKWEEERERIMSEDFKKYDGLILDLNLEELPNVAKVHSLYKGSSLAQEIRNISKAGEIKETPIVLLSATVNLEKYFDKTNEDLFDLIIARDSLGTIYIPTRNKLIALAEGYQLLKKCKAEKNLSDLFKRDIDSEDIRFVSEMKSIIEYPVHTISNFIIKNFLERSGLLISEELLATRLGIDLTQSKDWSSILKSVGEHGYYGVYSSGWKRWWMSGIEQWWTAEIDAQTTLRSLKAEERVKRIKEKLKLNDVMPLQKLEKARSESFWTNCLGSGASIDTIDGLLVANQDNLFPWQDKSYISFEEALKPTNKEAWKKVSPIEEYKLEQLKIRYPNERPK